MKSLILIIALSFGINSTNTIEHTKEWSELVTKDNVTVLYKYADCIFDETHDQEWVLLKLQNNNDYNVEVSWIVNAFYGERCEGCNRQDDPEILRKQKLNANGSVEGSCAIPMDNLAVFANSLVYKVPQPLTNIEIENLNIRRLN